MAATDNNSRKRARDEGPDNTETLEAKKKKECLNRYEFYDGIGVFDFPWLKGGTVFNSEASFEDHEDKFGPCLYVDEAGASFDQSCSLKNLSVSSAVDANSNSQDRKIDGDDDGFWSLLVDDLEPVDCIWSCVIDQPLHLAFNKSRS